MKVVASPFISFSASTFTGKETDCETGFSYFGARYYDPTLLTGWTAVDPMADKYPSLSPYNYCAWNPIKLVDPDGMDTIFAISTTLKNNPIEANGLDRNTNNKTILTWLRKEGDISGMVTVGMHGSSTRVAIPSKDQTTTSMQFAEDFYSDYIMGKWGNDAYVVNGQGVFAPTIFLLYSCHTGEGEGSFAETLSSYPGIITIAPKGLLEVSSSSQNMRVTRENNMTSDWGIFYKGKEVGGFNGSPAAWIKSHNGVSGTTDYIIEQYDMLERKLHPEW